MVEELDDADDADGGGGACLDVLLGGGAGSAEAHPATVSATTAAASRPLLTFLPGTNAGRGAAASKANVRHTGRRSNSTSPKGASWTTLNQQPWHRTAHRSQ